jgi:uncharacterized protein (DUF1501 family)
MNNFSRKDFLRITALASATMMLPKFLRGADTNSQNIVNNLFLPQTNGKRLIVVQFSGGNDGLNMVIPHGNDLYHSNRPTVGIKVPEVLKFDDYHGLNPNMKGIHDLYNNGHFAALNCVGYPDPNRSHFRSMDIWHGGCGPEEYITTGWIGRYLDSLGEQTPPHQAVEIDDTMSLALKGETRNGIANRNPKKMRILTEDKLLMQIANDYKHHESDHALVDYLHQCLAETSQSAQYLIEKAKIGGSKSIYPQHQFGKQMNNVADLILAGSETSIFYVTLTGFDTHAGQNNQQNRLLGIYSQAMEALAKDLQAAGKWNDTLVMTFSEFGRRVKQNASQGTDHGTANVVMFAGGALKKKGVITEAADLKNLEEGDLIYKIDFRQVYATVLQNWLGANHETVLGKKFELLDFI